MIDKLFNTYDLTARVAPIIFALAPALIGLLALIYHLTESVQFTFVIAVLLLVVSPIVRTLGRLSERDIFDNWEPVAYFLKYRDISENSSDKQKYYICPLIKRKCHEKISIIMKKENPKGVIKEFNLPEDVDDENSWEEQRKKDMYEIAGNCLIDTMRGKGKWEIVYDKNVRFAFVRNLYSVKGVSKCLNVFVFACVSVVVFTYPAILSILSKLTFIDFSCKFPEVCAAEFHNSLVLFLLYLIYTCFTLLNTILLCRIKKEDVIYTTYEYAKQLMVSMFYYDEVMYGGTSHKQGELNDD